MIENIEIARLLSHPREESVYGGIVLDPKFINSVAERGVLQPIIVALNATVQDGAITILEHYADNPVIVAGHRRVSAAIASGESHVPCVGRVYNSASEIDIDFLASNLSREKKRIEKDREFLMWKMTLQEYAKERELKGLRNVNSVISEAENIAGEVTSPDAFFGEKTPLERLFEIFGGDVLEPGRTRNKIATKLNISAHHQRQATAILDDEYMDGVFKRLRKKGATEQAIRQMYESWLQIRKGYTAESLTAEQAFLQVEELRKNAEKALEKPQRKPRIEKKQRESVAKVLVFSTGKHNFSDVVSFCEGNLTEDVVQATAHSSIYESDVDLVGVFLQCFGYAVNNVDYCVFALNPHGELGRLMTNTLAIINWNVIWQDADYVIMKKP